MNDNDTPSRSELLSIGSQPGKKIRGTFLLPSELLDELRDASYWARQSLARIAERALTAELKRLRDEHNSGVKFGRRPAA
jgi:hypothetical protein